MIKNIKRRTKKKVKSVKPRRIFGIEDYMEEEVPKGIAERLAWREVYRLVESR